MTVEVDVSGKVPLGPALVIEDNPIIALDTQTMLEELGFAPVSVLTSLKEGIAALASNIYEFVILDVKIGDETSLKFAETLRDRGTRFVFASGYSDTDDLPAAFKDHTVLRKPYTREQIQEHIS